MKMKVSLLAVKSHMISQNNSKRKGENRGKKIQKNDNNTREVQQTMKRASAFISSNFSEHELIAKASEIKSKTFCISLDVLLS